MAELDKYSEFDITSSARSLEQQYVQVLKSKPGFVYQHTSFFKKTTIVDIVH